MNRIWITAAIVAVGGFVALPHDFHVTYGRVAVEGSVVQARVRFFRDDLRVALQAFSMEPELRLAANPAVDSVFVAYFARHFELISGTDTLTASIAASGDETDNRESVWWYLMDFEAPGPISELTIRSTLLFERFNDQKNIVKIQHFPSEKQATYYLSSENPVQTFQMD